MRDPKRVARQEIGHCVNLDGDYWTGPARLSLVDSAGSQLLHTIEIHRQPDGTVGPEDVFSIPAFVQPSYYIVPNPNAEGKGTPKILYEYEACGITQTSVLGYSPATNQAVQYQVETTEGKHKPTLGAWVSQNFNTEPIRPGYWRFTWEAGHGDWFWNHEEVSFDRKRQLFVERLNRTPYPGFGEASCDLETTQLAGMLQSVQSLFEKGFSDSVVHDLEQMAETLPPIQNLTATISAIYDGKATDLEISIKKYNDGGLGLWVVTEAKPAAAIQATIDQALAKGKK